MLIVTSALNNAFVDRHPMDVARFLEEQGQDVATALLVNMPLDALKVVWHCLTYAKREDLFLLLPVELAVSLLTSLDVAPCAAFLQRLNEDQQSQYLAKLPTTYARQVKEFMQYPAHVAGSMMSKVTQSYNGTMTVGQAIGQIKQQKLIRSIYIYIVDNDLKLKGRVNLQKLLSAADDEQLAAVATTNPLAINSLTPKDEIMQTIQSCKFDSLPVVDMQGHMIGILYASRLIESITEEVTSDMQTMVGASADEEALSSAKFAVHKRLPWLIINLLTAFLAASVVGIFQGLIGKYTSLAVLLPVVAGQAGNAGAQALAVTMRGLALREISLVHWFTVISKELIVGCSSGVAVAIVCAGAIYFWSGNLGLAMIMAISMTISLAIACVSGALIPIGLKAIGQDPAQSSTIILTTVTDVVGIFSFLETALLLAKYL